MSRVKEAMNLRDSQPAKLGTAHFYYIAPLRPQANEDSKAAQEPCTAKVRPALLWVAMLSPCCHGTQVLLCKTLFLSVACFTSHLSEPDLRL